MEQCQAATLAQEIAEAPLPVQKLLRRAIDIASAVNLFHRKARVHGGIEPANIILTSAGVELGDPAPDRRNITPYTAPEQFRDVTDARGDIFAFGAVVYEMATGWKAFTGDTPDELRATILEKRPPSIAFLQTDPAAATFYAAMDRVVASCLVKNPDQRRQRMQNVLADLKLMASLARAVPFQALAPPPVPTQPVDPKPRPAAPSPEAIPFHSTAPPVLPSIPQPARLTVEAAFPRPADQETAAAPPEPIKLTDHAVVDVPALSPFPAEAKVEASVPTEVPPPIFEKLPVVVPEAGVGSIAKPLNVAPPPSVAANAPTVETPAAAQYQSAATKIPDPMQLSSPALEEEAVEESGTAKTVQPGAVERQASEILSLVGFGQPAPYVIDTKEKKKKRHKEEIAEEEEIEEEKPEHAHVKIELSSESQKRNWVRVFKAAAILAAAALLALAGVAASALLRKPASQLGTLRFALPAPEQASYMSSPAISPDGKLLAFSAVSPEKKRLLWIRPLSSLTAMPLEHTEDALAPFWSPDGKSIGFFAGKKLKKIPVEGGTPVVLCDTDGLAGGGTWSQDGVIVFGRSFYDGLYRVPAAGGAAEHLTKLDSARKERAHLWPLFLPDGQHFLYYALSEQEDNNGVSIGALDGRDARHLLSSDTNAIYAELPAGRSSARGGYLLFGHSHRLTARPFDAAKLTFTGEAINVADEVNYLEFTNLLPISASANGLLAYQSIDAPKRQLVWFDREGNQTGVLGEPAEYGQARISPDATQVAVNRLTPNKETADIWLFDVDSNRPYQFTAEATHEGAPVWSPDGRQLVYFSNPNGHFDLFRKGVGPTAKQETMLASLQDKYPNDWSADGKYLIFGSIGRSTNSDIWILPMKAKAEPYVYLQTVATEGYAQFSPDGKWMAFQSDESGRPEVYVESFPRAEGESKRWQISTEGGGLPKWRGDGKEIYYIMGNGKIMAVTVNAKGPLSPSTPRTLFQTRALPRTWNLFDTSPDGKRFLVNTPLEWATSSPITVVANWTEGFNKPY